MKGITPVISVMVLLLITFALLLMAQNYLTEYLSGKISKNFEIPGRGIYCQGGTIYVYATNRGTTKLTASDFELHKVDDVDVDLSDDLISNGIERGKMGKVFEYTVTERGKYYTVHLGGGNTIIHNSVYCP
jgi:flagellin-like protein